MKNEETTKSQQHNLNSQQQEEPVEPPRQLESPQKYLQMHLASQANQDQQQQQQQPQLIIPAYFVQIFVSIEFGVVLLKRQFMYDMTQNVQQNIIQFLNCAGLFVVTKDPQREKSTTNLGFYCNGCDIETVPDLNKVLRHNVELFLGNKDTDSMGLPRPVNLRNTQSDVSTSETKPSTSKHTPAMFANKQISRIANILQEQDAIPSMEAIVNGNPAQTIDLEAPQPEMSASSNVFVLQSQGSDPELNITNTNRKDKLSKNLNRYLGLAPPTSRQKSDRSFVIKEVTQLINEIKSRKLEFRSMEEIRLSLFPQLDRIHKIGLQEEIQRLQQDNESPEVQPLEEIHRINQQGTGIGCSRPGCGFKMLIFKKTTPNGFMYCFKDKVFAKKHCMPYH